MLRPTAPTKAKLAVKGRQKTRVKLIFRPKDGGAAASITAKVTLRA